MLRSNGRRLSGESAGPCSGPTRVTYKGRRRPTHLPEVQSASRVWVIRGSCTTLRGRTLPLGQAGGDSWQGCEEGTDEMGHIGSRSKWWPGVRRHHAGVPRPEDFEASDSYLKSNSANGQRGKCRAFQGILIFVTLQIFTEHLLCAKCCFRHRRYSGKQRKSCSSCTNKYLT